MNHKPLPPGVKPKKVKLAAERAAILEQANGRPDIIEAQAKEGN